MGTARRRYHQVALAPYLGQLAGRVELDRVARARQLLDGGLDRMLDALDPTVEMRGDALVFGAYPCFCGATDVERWHRLVPAGRGLPRRRRRHHARRQEPVRRRSARSPARPHLSLSSVSEHVTVLRNADLVQTTRAGLAVRHTSTRRGRWLLDG